MDVRGTAGLTRPGDDAYGFLVDDNVFTAMANASHAKNMKERRAQTAEDDQSLDAISA